MDSCGESFFFYGLTDFILFLVLAWRYGFFLSEIFFIFFYPKYLAFGSVRHEPCPTTKFFFSSFHWREEGATYVFRVPASDLASTFFLLVSGDLREVTEYKHLFLTVMLWRLATVYSNRRIVVASQRDTTWQVIQYPERQHYIWWSYLRLAKCT